MKRAVQSLIRLYPAHWRERYGEEFSALIEDSSPGWRAAFDLLKGAIKMQLSVPSFPKLALILSLTGLVAGLGVSTLVTPRYVSSATMQMMVDANPSASHPNLRERLSAMEQEILSRTSLSAIIKDSWLDLYKQERTRVPFEDVIEQMWRDLSIRLVSPGSDYVSFTISFSYSDRIKARDTVQAVITRFIDWNLVMQRTAAQTERVRSSNQVDRLEVRIAALEKRLGITSPPAEPPGTLVPAYGGIQLEVLDVPSLPAEPVYPNRAVFMATGFGAGFAAAIVVAVFRRRPPPIPFPAQTA